jgi:hypothetical protein
MAMEMNIDQPVEPVADGELTDDALDGVAGGIAASNSLASNSFFLGPSNQNV